jgi:hypothetical protein
MNPARRLTRSIVVLAIGVAAAASIPFIVRAGPGPQLHTSVRGTEVTTYGVGPYRHMPADVAVQGLAQDLVTLLLAVPFLLTTLIWARKGTRGGHLALTGAIGYLFVQYLMYLAMATYNELFLLWVALVLLSSQALFRLLLAVPPESFVVDSTTSRRRYVGGFLLVNGGVIALLWLQVIVPPLLDGSLYPAGLAHFTTMIVQGFDLALFIPPSLIAGWSYLKGRALGELLAPVYAVFLSLQMVALLAKIVWMSAIGVSAGPALVVIPMLLVGALAAALVSIQPHRNARLPQ